MKLDDIMDTWAQDAQMDDTELMKESLRIPVLHHKYFKMYSQECMLLKKLEFDYRNLYKLKYEYYMGILDRETLDQNGWTPNPLKILKTDLSIYTDSDGDLQTIQIKVDVQKQKINFLESVIKVIMNRGFLIKNSIDFMKFTSGAG